MTSTLGIIYSTQPGSPETALAKLAEFSGIQAAFIDFRALFSASLDAGCLVLTAQTLADIDSSAMLPTFKHLVKERTSHLMLTGFSPCASHSKAIRAFTDGRVISASRAMSRMRPYVVSKRSRPVAGPIAGLSITPVAAADCIFLTRDDSDNVDEIISIGGRGHFVKMRLGACETYLLGCAGPLDIDKPISGAPLPRHYFSALFPVLMFVRQAFGRRCWHRTHSHATLTIDDPLLVDRYGFVHYRELQQLMDRYNFFTTIAFIPWNFTRTSLSVARLLGRRKDRLSICMHGCDHTRHEMASNDYGELNGRIKLAIIRMLEHERLTHIPFDRVMVFPQGAFSIACMEVLKANNLLAAVNLETTPIHFFDPMPLRHFLKPAITAFGDFPLFQRRYPEELADIALDLFLNKPAFILDHHDFFQRQNVGAIRSIKKINNLDPTIRWSGLEDIIVRSYLQRQETDGTISVKALAGKTILSNDSDDKRQFTFMKEEAGNSAIEKVMVNGKERTHDRTESLLSFSLSVKPHTAAAIEVVYRDGYPLTQVDNSFYSNLKVFGRRRLSEIRDNYLSHSRTAMAVANRMKNLLA